MITKTFAAISAILLLIVLLSTGAGRADGIRTFDLFTAPAGKSDAGWKPCNGSPPVAYAGAGGTVFPCVFKNGSGRVFWDRNAALNMAGYDVIELDLTCDHPEAVRSFGLYLKCGDGWRLWLTPLKEPGRQKMYFALRDAATEDNPRGWNAVNTIRISIMQGMDVNASVTVHAFAARVCSIALVRGTLSTPNAEEAGAARGAAARLSRWLNDLDIAHAVIEDSDVQAGRLRSARVAVLPYNPFPPAREISALKEFIGRGGRLIVFYAAEPELAALMRLRLGAYQAAATPDQWCGFDFNRNAPANLPAAVGQQSPNIRPVYPADSDARVIAYWRDAGGAATRDPAWVQSDRGLWMSHVLMDGDDERKQAMLLAMLGLYEPEVWREAAANALLGGGKVGPFDSLQEATAGIARLARGTPSESAVNKLLTQAGKESELMREFADRRQYPETVAAGRTLKSILVQAYAQAQAPKSAEFRGVWNHSGTGLYPGDWDKTCRVLAENGITAVFPNVLWAGAAHYASTVVPRSAVFEKYGDQLIRCAAAARRAGIEVHAWKICWNLGRTTDQFAEQLRRQDRLQVSDERKTLDWLCPSHPDNVALELKAIAELAGRGDLDGIHLDYVRYPDIHACYCSGCRQRFEEGLGRRARNWPNCAKPGGSLNNEFTAWRAARITAFVKAARETIRKINPRLKLSAAVYRSYPECIGTIGQDWGLWLKQGLLDFVCPMDYCYDSGTFGSLVLKQVALPGAQNRIIPGIGVTAAESRLTPDRAIEQILRAREAGARGFILFDLNRTLEQDILPMLSLGLTRPPE